MEIVGAGLAGLTAAISLARAGHQVLVHDRQDRIGGRKEFRPDPAGSPFNLRQLAAYTGIDISPVVHPLRSCRYRLWGKPYRYSFPGTINACMVERGSRQSSLDSHLYGIARGLGVKFAFGETLSTRGDFEALPARSIIATGLEAMSFEALGIPYEPSYSWCAKDAVPFRDATVAVYLGPFTKDYGFSCTVNGVALAFLFQRCHPLTAEAKVEFRKQVEATEPFRLKGWRELAFGGCPSGSWRNPRLFWSDKILAGSVGGNMDPLLNFGMLGAMLSGRIAALAVSNPKAAAKEFRRLNLSFYPLLAARRVLVRLQEPLREWIAQQYLQTFFRLPGAVQRTLYFFVPGYGRMG